MALPGPGALRNSSTPEEVRQSASVRSAPHSLSLLRLVPTLQAKGAGAWLLVFLSRAGKAGGFQPFVSSKRMKVPRNSCVARRSQRLLLCGCCSSRCPCQSHQCDWGRRQPNRPMPSVHRQDGSGSGCRRGEGSAACRLPDAPGQRIEQNKERCCTQIQSDSKIKQESFAQGPFTRWH